MALVRPRNKKPYPKNWSCGGETRATPPRPGEIRETLSVFQTERMTRGSSSAACRFSHGLDFGVSSSRFGSLIDTARIHPRGPESPSGQSAWFAGAESLTTEITKNHGGARRLSVTPGTGHDAFLLRASPWFSAFSVVKIFAAPRTQAPFPAEDGRFAAVAGAVEFHSETSLMLWPSGPLALWNESLLLLLHTEVSPCPVSGTAEQPSWPEGIRPARRSRPRRGRSGGTGAAPIRHRRRQAPRWERTRSGPETTTAPGRGKGRQDGSR